MNGMEEIPMEILVTRIIFFYIFICVSLLIYDLSYIMLANHNKKKHLRRIRIWKKELNNILSFMGQGYSLEENHKIKLKRKLVRVRELMAYNEAIKAVFKEKDNLEKYFWSFRHEFRYLAILYKKRESMDRAFISFLLSDYYASANYAKDELGEILLTYLDDSTVYCRENVLHGLYSIGNIGAVENAFSMFNEMEWYHYPRLISDGLISFSGDKVELVWRLWKHLEDWEDGLIVAVIQFASIISDVFSQEFLLALEDDNTPLEIRYELLRYFQRWYYEPAGEFLIKCILSDEIDKVGLAIVASNVIGFYPGNETIEALKKAVLSQDWYVMRNAASSLVTLGITLTEVDEVKESGNLDAVDMLEYMIETDKRKVVSV